MCLSGAEPDQDQQDIEENEEDGDVLSAADCPAEEESHTSTRTPPGQQEERENSGEHDEQDGHEDVREEGEDKAEEEETETEATPSQSGRDEPETHESANEEGPDAPKETVERQEDDEEEDEDEDEDDDDDDDDDEEEEEEEADNEGQEHNDNCKTNGHVIMGAQERLSPPAPTAPLSSPLLCPLVESEISTTDRDASDASYELYNGETAGLTNGARHRGTAPRFPELPLDPAAADGVLDEAQALSTNSDRSRTVSSSSTGDTPKGQTHFTHTDTTAV